MDHSCPPHHWKIVEANGPTSEGQCIKCSEMRTFANSHPERVYNGQQLGWVKATTLERKGQS